MSSFFAMFLTITLISHSRPLRSLVSFWDYFLVCLFLTLRVDCERTAKSFRCGRHDIQWAFYVYDFTLALVFVSILQK